MAGRTDVVQLAALIARAGRVLCGDTGVAHLAPAFGIPSVVLFGPVPPSEWGPPPGLACWPMNHGCHGALVETQATSSISHWVHTGLVVSGVEATSIRSTLSRTIRSFATSAARLGLDWLSLTLTSMGRVVGPELGAVAKDLERLCADKNP